MKSMSPESVLLDVSWFTRLFTSTALERVNRIGCGALKAACKSMRIAHNVFA